MKKYLALYQASVMRSSTYRGPLLIWSICGLISVITVIAVWQSSDAGLQIAGYTKNQLITYSLVGVILGGIITFNPFNSVKTQIKDGIFATRIMLKPVSYFKERFVWECGWKTNQIIFNISVAVIVGLFIRQFLVLSSLALSSPFFYLAILTGIMLQFLFTFCLGLLAFWFTEVDALNSLKWLIIGILGGSSLPISFIPGAFQILVRLLPFRYMFSFPMEILFGKLTSQEIFNGFLIALVWIAVFAILYKILYQEGIKKYVSVGQ